MTLIRVPLVLLQRIGAFMLSLIDREDTAPDIRQTAEDIHTDIVRELEGKQ